MNTSMICAYDYKNCDENENLERIFFSIFSMLLLFIIVLFFYINFVIILYSVIKLQNYL